VRSLGGPKAATTMTPPVSADETLEIEARTRRQAVALCAVAAITPLAGAIASGVVSKNSPDNTIARALFYDEKATALNLTAAITAVGVILTGVALQYLFRSTKLRRPEMPGVFRWTALAGALLMGIGGFVYQIENGITAGHFAAEGSQTYQQYLDMFPGSVASAAAICALLGSFVLGGSIIVVSINAMRVGLLPRFTGYVGVFAGVFTALPLLPSPIVLSFWLGAVAALYAGKWPGEQPPAWVTGRAEPWPAPAGRGGAGGARGGRGARQAEPAQPAEPTPVPQPAIVNPGAARRKRKRKR
jgi:hypothetical protein